MIFLFQRDFRLRAQCNAGDDSACATLELEELAREKENY
jgi:hypothetical protein